MGKNVYARSEDVERMEESDFWSKVKLKLVLWLVKGISVLDVGCGSGRLSEMQLGKGLPRIGGE